MTPFPDPLRRRAVFLDRDGVINEMLLHDGRPSPPMTREEFRLKPGIVESCRRLREAGYLLIVATNQPDVPRGKVTKTTVEDLHALLRERVEVDDIRVCYHDDAHGCACRKPNPGMLLEAAQDWNVDLASSFMVGDRWRDVEAGRRAGCRTVLVKGVFSEREYREPDCAVGSVEEAAEWILTSRVSAKEGEIA